MDPIPEQALSQLFSEARSFGAWQPKDVDEETLRSLYELMKWGPTSANTSPARIVFVKGRRAKEELIACVAPGNVEKVRAAPVTAIIAMDEKFYDEIPRLLPSHPMAATFRSMFANDKALAEASAFRNSSLQGAYLMLAARALGLDVGPMSGFDNKKVDAAFLAGTTWKSNFICSLGHGDRTKLFPRMPRLPFDDACRIA
jgi:nitroreductase